MSENVNEGVRWVGGLMCIDSASFSLVNRPSTFLILLNQPHSIKSMTAPTDFRAELAATAQHIVAAGKGILAADESTGTIGNI